MTTYISILISIASVTFAIIIGVLKFNFSAKKDLKDDTTERATMNAMLMTKLESISDDIKDIQRDNKELRLEVQKLHDRVLILEQRMQVCPMERTIANEQA